MCEPCKNLWMVHQGKRLLDQPTEKLYGILLKTIYEKHVEPIMKGDTHAWNTSSSGCS